MRILVPTDFSTNSWKTMQYIVDLMHHKKCNFKLLHTYELPSSSSGEIIDLHDNLKAEAEAKLLSLKKEIADFTNSKLHTINCQALHGDFLRVINRVAEEEKFDLIAISLTNKIYPDKVQHKGYAKRIIDNCKTPVIVVPDCYQADGIKLHNLAKNQ